VGHRGCKHPELNIPENSIEAMRFAIDHKVDGIEIDIMLSKDGVPMVFHDTNSMSRVCQQRMESTDSAQEKRNADPIEQGIPQMTKQQIQTQFEYIKGKDRSLSFVPTLHEFIDSMFAHSPNKVLMIEIKEYERSAEMADIIIETFKKYPHLYRQSVVASFNPIVLYMVRRRDPNIVTNLLFCKNFLAGWMDYNPKVLKAKDYPVFLERLHRSYYNKILSIEKRFIYWLFKQTVRFWDWLLFFSITTWIPDLLGAGVLGFHNTLAYDLEFVKSLQRRGYRVNVWVVNTMKQKRELQKLGNVAITTDFLFDYSHSPEVYKSLPQSIKDSLNE
jgi:glycerophosphoinositol glycerophosphodiesterase